MKQRLLACVLLLTLTVLPAAARADVVVPGQKPPEPAAETAAFAELYAGDFVDFDPAYTDALEGPVEVLFADGGSIDGTVEAIGGRWPVLACPKGRAAPSGPFEKGACRRPACAGGRRARRILPARGLDKCQNMQYPTTIFLQGAPACAPRRPLREKKQHHQKNGDEKESIRFGAYAERGPSG